MRLDSTARLARFVTLLGLLTAPGFLRAEEPEPPAAEEEVQQLLERIGELEDLRRVQGGELTGLLAHPTPAVRARAACALGRIQAPDSLRPLGALVGDPDTGVVLEAVFALGQLFRREASGYLLPLLESRQSPLRQAAVTALGKTGDRNATPLLLALLEDSERGVRGAVPLACARLADQNATTALCERLAEEPDPHVRWRIVYALATLRDERAQPALLQALEDRSLPLIRMWAARGLQGAVERPEIREALLGLRGDPDTRVVVELLRVVAARPTHFHLEDLEPLVTHSSFHVRALLATAVAEVSGAGATALLETLRADDSPTVAASATVALARLLGRYALPMLAAAAQDPDWRTRRAAVEGYGYIAGVRAMEAIEQLLQDDDVRVRVAAVSACGGRTDGQALACLLESLRAPDIAVRGTAVEALVARPTPAALDPLLRALRSWKDRQSFELREMIVEGLGRFGDPRALPALEECLEDPFASVRAAAARSIAHLSGEPEVAWEPPEHAEADDPEAPPEPAQLPPGSRAYVALVTRHGEILIELYPDLAPRHVARFLQSVEQGLYEGLTFHRVVSNFVVQGGDPLGHGWGDAGFSLRDEINPRQFLTGTLGMPKAGKDTGGCQFFITHSPQPRLDGLYTVFGGVRVGMEVVEAIEVGDQILSIRRIDWPEERSTNGGR